MVLLLQISADDIAGTHTHTNSILKPLLNLIKASFGESERPRGKKRGFSKSFTFFSSGLKPGRGIHSINVKDRA